MKTFVEMVYALEREKKDAVQEQYIKRLSPEGRQLVQEALNPYRVFNIKQVDRPRSYRGRDVDVEHFLKLLERLESREVTGQEARDEVTITLGMYTELTSRALERVLIKNLRIGATAKTFNKYWPGLVPTFDLMLAEVVDDPSEVVYPVRAEVKYDGMRNIAVVTKSGVQHLSRKGLHQPDFEVFNNSLQDYRSATGLPGIVLDGEVLSANFQETMKRGKVRALTFYVFDFMPLDQWERKDARLVQSDRTRVLLDNLRDDKYLGLRAAAGKTVFNAAAAKEFFQQHVGEGFKEGLILKDLNAKYEWKRSKRWIKWKPTRTWDLTVEDWKYGKKGGQHEHTLGAMMCAGKDENGNRIRTSVGNGIPADLRAELFKLAKAGKLKGLVVEVEADAMTKAQDSDFYSLRFPRVSKIRFDK